MSPPAGKLDGKVALVTGAGRGLGRTYALRLASLGADVVVNDIDLGSAADFGEILGAETVCEEIETLGRRALGIQGDVTGRDSVEAMFATILDTFGRLDILVNNAGGAQHEGDRDLASVASPQRLAAILDANLGSTINCCQTVSGPMCTQGSGRIVNIASQAGLWSGRDGGHMPYKVAKAAVVAYSRILAAELGPYGVNVNCIAPGFVATSRLAPTWEAAGSALTDQIALRRVARPEEVAGVVEFLVTDLSDYVTGQCLPVCGGYVAW